MPLSRRSPKLCPWTEWEILNGGSSSSSRSTEFSNPPKARKHDFFLHFMVCWIFCFSCYIAGIMFMALEYSCGFPNASDLIWHLPHAQKFIASYTLSLWMLSLPQFCGGVLETDNDPVELFSAGEKPCLVPQQTVMAQEDSSWWGGEVSPDL